MPIDPSIALRINPVDIPDPMAQYGRAMQLKGMIGQQDLQSMQLDELRRDTAERETLAGVYRDALDPDGTLNRPRLLLGVARSGLGAQIPGLQQSFATTDKAGADLANVRSQTSERDLKSRRDGLNFTAQQFGAVLSNPNWTDDDIVGAAARIAASGAMPAEQVKGVIDTFPWGNRAALEQRLRQGITSAMSAADQLAAQIPKLVERSDGQVKSFADVNPLTNPGGPAPLQMRATPEAMLTDERTRTEGGLNRGVTMRGQNLTDARARDAAQASRDSAATGRIPTGYRMAPDGQSLEFTPGGPADPARERMAAPSEDERKAAGWLQQATNAYKNILDVLAVDPSAAQPAGSIRSAIGSFVQSVPIVGQSTLAQGAGNFIKPENRQRFEQASESLSEALLRAATGAGQNEAEARQKIRELTPRFGENDRTTQQKLDAIPMYLEALQARAGRAAPKGYQMPGAAPGGPAGAAPGGRPPLTAFERP